MKNFGKDTSPTIHVVGRTTHIRFHFHQLTVSSRPALGAGTPHWVPPIDLYDTADEIVLEIGLAGVGSDEMSIEFSGRAVQITGHRRDAAETGRRNYHVMEIERGRFSRTIELPCPVEPSTVRATYTDGLLVVRALKRRGTIHGCNQARNREGLE